MESRRSLASEAGSLILVFAAVFCFVALLSYFPADPSLFSISNAHGAAHNACGKVGAYVSSLLLECLGVGAFLIPAALAFVATVVFKREGSVKLLGTMGGMSVAVTAGTVFLALTWKHWTFGGAPLLTGGAFGVWLSDLLMKQFNSVGSALVSLLVFCIAIALSTPLSIAQWGGWLLKTVAVLIFRCTKILLTYLGYFGGVAIARLAHASGDLLQRLVETGAHHARMRAIARAQAREQRQVEIEKARSQADVIEVQALKRAGTAGVAVGESIFDFTNESPKDDSIGADPSIAAATITVGHPLSGDAPNALPELEASPAPPSLQAKQSQPAILPPLGAELSGTPLAAGVPPTEAATGAAAIKAAAKLEEERKRRSKRGLWKIPPVDFLRKPPKIESSIDREKLLQNSQILTQKFLDFGIEGEVMAVRPGPVITLYEFRPGPGVKVSRIAALADDLSMALSAQSVRILAPLPGKSVVGIEIPSEKRETVFLREFLQHTDFHGPKYTIPVVMGKDIAGQPYLSDLSRMPHLLCAGQTGAGKSVFMNGLICSLLYRFTPDELRMVLVDPKFIEFRSYQDIPHLLLPVVDDPKQAATALKWAVREMERRYRILAMMGARNLASFNQKVEEMGKEVVRDLLLSEENQTEGMEKLSGGDWLEAFEADESGSPQIGKLPYIVIIIDELADLMMIAKKDVEISIARIAQKARAAGIHLVIATQRPSTDVVTGLIKANLPSRVSFQLASYIDSKTILDRQGAERLLGQGDMLFVAPGSANLIRLHGAFVDDDEINKVTAFLKSQGKPVYRDEILVDDEEDESFDSDEAASDDELFTEAVELVKRSGHASASFLQRHLKVGYNRAARMIETMESRGIVGPQDGARPREVLMR